MSLPKKTRPNGTHRDCSIKLPVKFFKPKTNSPQPPKYQDVFGHTLVELAEKNPKIMGVTPAMPSGSSLNIMMKAMPDRAFDVGIAEQHAVTFSAGLATQGFDSLLQYLLIVYAARLRPGDT
jgi:deoxyxylulose-5-phosphate synthase